MNKLEVGMYVRTKSGLIAKYTGFEKDENDDEYNKYNFDGKIYWFYEYYNEYVYEEDFEYWFENSVVKTSHNIIDLIEAGDVITTNNLCGQVTCIEGDKIYTTCYDGECCYDYQIQSIVTKEQFSGMEYRLGE